MLVAYQRLNHHTQPHQEKLRSNGYKIEQINYHGLDYTVIGHEGFIDEIDLTKDPPTQLQTIINQKKLLTYKSRGIFQQGTYTSLVLCWMLGAHSFLIASRIPITPRKSTLILEVYQLVLEGRYEEARIAADKVEIKPKIDVVKF